MSKQFSKSVSVSGNRPTASINFHTNENSMIIKGSNSQGRVDKSILFSDPDYKQKVKDAFEEIKLHQRSELESFITDAIEKFDEQAGQMELELAEYLSEDSDSTN